MKFEIFENHKTLNNLISQQFLVDYGEVNTESYAKNLFISEIKSQNDLIDYIILRKNNENINVTYTLINIETNKVLMEIGLMQNELIDFETGEIL